jgi:drug/metabolite transporter (DMT)-like permease
MLYLFLASIIWAFSFGLIKGQLTGIDSYVVSFIRLFLSLIVFLPFLRVRLLDYVLSAKLIGIGMVQYGIMYMAYIYSYQFLPAHQIALFTILTPIYVTLTQDIFIKKLNVTALLAAIVSIFGATIIVYRFESWQGTVTGFLIIQISNICFALGQVLYKKTMKFHKSINDKNIFALLYFGAVLITLIPMMMSIAGKQVQIAPQQFLALIYLGVVASGIGFFLWNSGARRTSISQLAVMNNLKIPLAVLISLVLFKEDANVSRLIAGSSLILGALYFNQRKDNTVIDEI